MANDKSWFIFKDGEEIGPLKIEEMQAFISSGKLDQNKDMIRNSDSEGWSIACNVIYIFSETCQDNVEVNVSDNTSLTLEPTLEETTSENSQDLDKQQSIEAPERLTEFSALIEKKDDSSDTLAEEGVRLKEGGRRTKVSTVLGLFVIIFLFVLYNLLSVTVIDIKLLALTKNYDKIEDIVSNIGTYNAFDKKKITLTGVEVLDKKSRSNLLKIIRIAAQDSEKIQMPFMSLIKNCNISELELLTAELSNESSITYNDLKPDNFRTIFNILSQKSPDSLAVSKVITIQHQKKLEYVRNDLNGLFNNLSSPEKLNDNKNKLEQYNLDYSELQSIQEEYLILTQHSQDISDKISDLEDDKTGINANIDDLNTQIQEQQLLLDAEALNPDTPKNSAMILYGYIISKISDNEYEVEITGCSEPYWETGRAILTTQYTTFTSKGNFSMAVSQYVDSRQVTTVDGFQQDWPVYYEVDSSDSDEINNERKEVNSNISALQESIDSARKGLKADDDQINGLRNDLSTIEASRGALMQKWQNGINNLKAKVTDTFLLEQASKIETINITPSSAINTSETPTN